jgi:hypothetical protein
MKQPNLFLFINEEELAVTPMWTTQPKMERLRLKDVTSFPFLPFCPENSFAPSSAHMNLNMNLNLNPGARCLRPDRSYFHPARRPVRGMAIFPSKNPLPYTPPFLRNLKAVPSD